MNIIIKKGEKRLRRPLRKKDSKTRKKKRSKGSESNKKKPPTVRPILMP